MGKLFTDTVGNYLTTLLGNYLTGVVGKALDIPTFLDLGMGRGPALALLLAGPALSLPNMLVIRTIMGTKRTLVYIALVVVMSTFVGMIFGRLVS